MDYTALIQEAQRFLCLGASLSDGIELSLLEQICYNFGDPMAAIPTNTLLDEAKCYMCFGTDVNMVKAMKLALLSRTLKALVPSADTTAQTLLTYAKCYACYGASAYELIELALLDQISQAA